MSWLHQSTRWLKFVKKNARRQTCQGVSKYINLISDDHSLELLHIYVWCLHLGRSVIFRLPRMGSYQRDWKSIGGQIHCQGYQPICNTNYPTKHSIIQMCVQLSTHWGQITTTHSRSGKICIIFGRYYIYINKQVLSKCQLFLLLVPSVTRSRHHDNSWFLNVSQSSSVIPITFLYNEPARPSSFRT